ncbi:hypothetical protein CEQ90_10675 [Lewinellaceae bacterium SD302]|nr:hypothetical protein CEQ90_10675 [Lewinellaceae bacterium SD302]
MKFQILFMCLLSSVFLIAGCDDDGVAALPIQIRILNNTGEDLSNVDLRFNLDGAAGDYEMYGSLADGEISAPMGFEAGGSCDSDLFFCMTDNDQCESVVALCECICPLSEGSYTGTIDLIETPDDAVYTFDLSLDE